MSDRDPLPIAIAGVLVAGEQMFGINQQYREVGRVTSADQALIDASVHVFFKSRRDLNTYLREPFKSPRWPGYMPMVRPLCLRRKFGRRGVTKRHRYPA